MEQNHFKVTPDLRAIKTMSKQSPKLNWHTASMNLILDKIQTNVLMEKKEKKKEASWLLSPIYVPFAFQRCSRP